MKRLFIITVGLFWSLTNTAQSLAQLNYSEKKTKNQQQTSSGATRGCRGNLPQLQLLAPPDKIAVMGSEKTFLLNLSELSPYPLKISILEPYVPESLWTTELRPKQPGLIKVSLPKTIALKPNQDYIFTATIPCNPEIPGSSIYVRALFQKSSLQYQDVPPVKQISLLLDQGIWYDALWISYQNKLPEFKQLLEMQGIELEE